ncbi:MAG: hypothetical protein U1F54_16640 [Burkholderiales bacterium]
MSVGKKNKDHLKDHAGAALVAPAVALRGDDPLHFWTNHPTESAPFDLHPFADGEFKTPHPNQAGKWGGPFTGRPQLIAEIAPALEARCALLSPGSIKNYKRALRAWWRLFDNIENASVSGGQPIAQRVESLSDLNELHEAFAHRSGMRARLFIDFVGIANDARTLLRLPKLLWEPPSAAAPVRSLIPEDQAREIKTALKQDWERVKRTWTRNDAISAEAAKRLSGETPSVLGEEEERLLRNCQYILRRQQETGRTLPAVEQRSDRNELWKNGIELILARSILFPTAQEADTAFHLALMNAGWNPSTLANLDGSSPTLVSEHPKDDKQIVLAAQQDEAVTIQADKPRARGKTQFCTGLKKHSSSPPVIVAMYHKRVEPLRVVLQNDYQAARAELERMQATGEEKKAIETQVKLVQRIWKGSRSVWLYVDRFGNINWLDGAEANRYEHKEMPGPVTYLWLVLEHLNARRAREGKAAIPPVTPSDFRDIYARWVYVQTGGNILAVMLALNHSSLRGTGGYLENNIFSAENDERARSLMTHLFDELERGRVDLTILAQLVRHGPLTPEMEARLAEYRKLMRSRVGAGCADPRNPPTNVAPGHIQGRLCGTHRCLKQCPHARFLPESLDGIAMRAEELLAMSDHLPRETWLRGGFQHEQDEGEALLADLYPPKAVTEARDKWHEAISSGTHLVPGLGRIASREQVA